MGLGGDADLPDEKPGAVAAAAAAIPCSICLDAVTSEGGRSTARLHCGHEFHLDCIGSAFNAKGVMQCPNCRKVEKGNWLYANGSPSLPDLNIHEWSPDEDLYELNYSEMPFGVHWCPFGRLAQVTSSFEDGESSPALSFQDILGRHGIYTDRPPTSSTAHPCPYMSYLQPVHLSTTSTSHVLSESLVEGPPYHHNWSQVSGPLDVHSAHALPATDRHYNIWEYHPPAFFSHGTRANSGDQTSVSSATRPPRLDSDGLSRAGTPVHPFMVRHRSRTGGSFPSSLVPPYLPNSGAQAHVHEHSQGNHGTTFAGVRRSGSSRGFTSAGPTSISPPDHTGFYYLFPPTQTSGQNLQDVESNEGNRFYAWERDRLAPFPLLRVDRESGWWGPVPQSTASVDSNNRMGFWHQHGAERPSSEGRSEGSTYWPSSTHASRMRPSN